MTGEVAADRRVHPGTVLLRFLREAPSTVFALPAVLAFASDTGIGRALALAAALGAVMLFVSWLAWSRFRYGVGEREIVIESGIVHRTRRSIPFHRIQDIDIERALLARIFGLAKVKIETGAGGKDEGVLDSVTLAEADRLRTAVRAWRRGEAEAPGAGEEAAPEPVPAEGRLLFAMDGKRVLLFGLFSFSLVYIASIFAFLQTFDRVLPFDIYDPGRWLGLFGEDLPARFTVAAAAAVLVVAVILGVLAGVLRTLSRDHGYRLTAEGERFRRERGLFTRSEVVIAKRRVQLAHVATGPVRRFFGWAGLSFQTLGAGSDGSGLQVAAPFATREEMEPVLAETGILRLPPAELHMVSRRHVVRTTLHAVLPPLAIILVAAAFRPWALLLLGLLPIVGAGAALQRRFHLYGIDGELMFIAKGIWRQQLWIVPMANAQAVSIARGPLQRRLGLATLSIDTAGASLMNAPRIVDVREETARALAAEIAARRPSPHSGRKSGTDR